MKIMIVLRIRLNEFACRSIEFHMWEFGILCEEYLTWRYVGSLDSTREFRIQQGISSYALDRLSVFKIDKISGSRSVCLYATVCLYLHQRLAY